MSKDTQLKHIEQRHGRDRVKDALFVGVALLLTAISIGSVTSKAAGKAPQHAWSLHVVEGSPEIQASR